MIEWIDGWMDGRMDEKVIKLIRQASREAWTDKLPANNGGQQLPLRIDLVTHLFCLKALSDSTLSGKKKIPPNDI